MGMPVLTWDHESLSFKVGDHTHYPFNVLVGEGGAGGEAEALVE